MRGASAPLLYRHRRLRVQAVSTIPSVLMTRARSAILLALLPAALALTNPLTAGAAATTVSTQPELFPQFDSKVTDYGIKCGEG